jgi:hypothetical protein
MLYSTLAKGRADMGKLGAIIDSGKKSGIGIEAYHGSPHDFDEFKTEAIGTGEGAQAYGHGLYFAESEDVARGYKKQLSARNSYAQVERDFIESMEDSGLDLSDEGVNSDDLYQFSLQYVHNDGDLSETLKDARRTARLLESDGQDAIGIRSVIKAIEKSENLGFKPPSVVKGSMYKVNIDADPDELVDWDAPVSEQPKAVQEVVAAYKRGGDLKQRFGLPYDPSDEQIMHRAVTAPAVVERFIDEGIKGVKYADAFTRHKSKDERSNNYVIFDPRIIGISKKYGISIPLASAVIAGTMSPEEAQAMGYKSVATQGIRSLGETLEFDPRFDPRKREQEGLQSLRVDVLPRNESMVKPPIRLSDLEGEDFVTSMSDRTRAGGMVMGINDVPLYRAVDLRGGQDFMFENPNQVWASAKKPSENILEMARELQGQSGKDPIFIPWRMAPTGGDFSNMVGELMLGFASSNMNKTTKKAFDGAVKKFRTKGTMDKGVRKNAGLKIKEWPGVDDPRAVEIWRSTPDSVRKELMNMMDVNFRKKGGLSVGAARLAASDPTQLMSRDAGLQNVGRIYTDRDITPSTHPSYPYAIPGEGIGALKGADEVTIFDLLPEARFGDAQKKVKDSANPTAREIRALQMKPYGGTITENILRRIEERGVDVSSLAGLAPGALAFTLTSAGLLTPEEASAGGLDEAAEAFGSNKKGTVVKPRGAPDDVAFKAARKPGIASLQQASNTSPALAALEAYLPLSQLGLGAASEIAGTLAGGTVGVGEYLRGLPIFWSPERGTHSPRPATAESIRNIREDVSGYVGGLYDASPEAQDLGRRAMEGIGGIVGPTIDYAMEGPIMGDRGVNMLPLTAQALKKSYEGWKGIYDLLPEREQEAIISTADVML